MKNAFGAEIMPQDERYPHGKLRDDDKGALAIKIGAEHGALIIDFGKPVIWIGFPPDEAIEFAELITKHANKMKEQKL